MRSEYVPNERRLVRLVEELAEEGLVLDLGEATHAALVAELDYALRPPVHERRVPSYGAIVNPTRAVEEWEAPTGLRITRRHTASFDDAEVRRFADGIASWAVRIPAGLDQFVVFDRPASSERDLVVLADAAGGTFVQRHPGGTVRAVGAFGLVRWDGLTWWYEPPANDWIISISRCTDDHESEVLAQLLNFALHDLGSRGIGALLVYRHDQVEVASLPAMERRLPMPPPLTIGRPADLAPLRHVLTQVDGATVFDRDGVLRELGVRLVPSTSSESSIAAYRGTRHTAARRYSADDPNATIIAVSEDGPVTVIRNGEIVDARET